MISPRCGAVGPPRSPQPTTLQTHVVPPPPPNARPRRRHAATAATAAAAGDAASASPVPPPYDCVSFSLIVDDIVLPDGATAMGQLGGGGAQALYGFALQRGGGARLALAAGVGADLPHACREQLRGAGIDDAGLLMSPDAQTPRAWQVLEDDGRRHEIWRRPADAAARAALLLPAWRALPAALRAARAYHCGVHPERPPHELLRALRRGDDGGGPRPRVSVETYCAPGARLPAAALEALVQACDIFSPNEREARAMLGVGGGASGDPLRLTRPLLDAGAKVVTLRLGAAGAVVHAGAAAGGGAWAVPAVAGLEVVDPTGCGNAFCGAFLAAAQGVDGGGGGGGGGGSALAAAAAWGCAAGAALAEARGLPRAPPAELHATAARRAAEALGRAVQLL